MTSNNVNLSPKINNGQVRCSVVKLGGHLGAQEKVGPMSCNSALAAPMKLKQTVLVISCK